MLAASRVGVPPVTLASSAAAIRALIADKASQDRSWRRYFLRHDEGRAGRITLPQFAAFTSRIGLQLTVPQIETVFAAWDVDADGCISFEEFVKDMERDARGSTTYATSFDVGVAGGVHLPLTMTTHRAAATPSPHAPHALRVVEEAGAGARVYPPAARLTCEAPIVGEHAALAALRAYCASRFTSAQAAYLSLLRNGPAGSVGGACLTVASLRAQLAERGLLVREEDLSAAAAPLLRDARAAPHCSIDVETFCKLIDSSYDVLYRHAPPLSPPA